MSIYVSKIFVWKSERFIIYSCSTSKYFDKKAGAATANKRKFIREQSQSTAIFHNRQRAIQNERRGLQSSFNDWIYESREWVTRRATIETFI